MAICKAGRRRNTSYVFDRVLSTSHFDKNEEYYSPILTYNGPAMSHSVYAVLSARMGACDKAKEFFDQSYIPHKIGPYGLISEAK